MSYFIFNGVSSEELGLIIKKPMIRPTWGESFVEKALTGGTRKLMQKTNYYDNSNMQIEAYIHDASPQNIQRIYSILRGEGELWISTAPEEVLDVIINPLVPQAVALLAADLPINVVCMPFAYALNPTTIDITDATKYTEIENRGTVFSAPEIKFVASSTDKNVDIKVNGNNGYFSVGKLEVGTEYIIDCELQVVYYIKDGQKIDVTANTKYNFPLLHHGKNYIFHNGNVSKMTVNVRERWL